MVADGRVGRCESAREETMARRTLRGIIPVVPTPLNDNETVDAPALRRILEYVIGEGVHGVWVLGSGGELPNLEPAEVRKAIETAVETVAGRVPVVVGVGLPGTRMTIAAAREAERLGADIVNVVPPYYYAYSEEQCIRHYQMVLESTDVPLVIYRRGDPPMGLAALEKVSQHPRVVAIKDVPSEFRVFQRMVAVLGPMGVGVLTAAGRLIHPAVAVGGHGAVAVEAAIAPKLCVAIYEAALASRNEEAAALQQKLYHLSNVLQVPPDHVSGLPKAALSLLGFCAPTVTAPFRPVEPSVLEKLRGALKAIDLL
jgi:4-hydroxy-tetrahydrodipicolinate synthase